MFTRVRLGRSFLIPLVPALFVATTLASRPAAAVGSAELYRPAAYVHGRYEARVQFAAGDGVISSFFLWKSGSEVKGAYWNELDIEKLGAACLGYSSNAIYGAPSASHQQILSSTADLCAGYHTHTIEWTTDHISWLLDGTEVRRLTGADVAAFEANATIGMQFHFNVWPGDASFGGTFLPSILPVYQYVNWVSYSSYQPGTGDNGTDFKFEWREDFDKPLGTEWQLGNWGSPKNYSTHTAANVVVVDGKAVLALTADNATGYTGHPPVDPADGAPVGGDAGQGGAAPTTGGTGGGVTTGQGGNGGSDAGTTPTPAATGGCSTAPGPSAATPLFALIALLVARVRRSRR